MILKPFFLNFYPLKVIISYTPSYPFMKCVPLVNSITADGSVSQIFYVGLSFYFMTQTTDFVSIFVNIW